MKTKVTCITCPNCKDTIYSRAHYDFHHCTCGDIFVDGGFEYTRIGGKGAMEAVVSNKFVMGVNRKDLYQDWNNQKDVYGTIKATIRKVRAKSKSKISRAKARKAVREIKK